MCAIFGSPDLSMFEVLYEANKSRGNFASSVITLMKTSKGIVDDVSIHKTDGLVNIEKLKLNPKQHAYYIGHVQAPTSAARKFKYETSHPFEAGDWLVFHNGVLTNHEKLNAEYCSWNTNMVDTSVIPEMIQSEWETAVKTKKAATNAVEIKIIEDVCSRLEGTFALAIVNTLTFNVYLVRQGSTLFINEKGSYSSIQGKGWVELPEGIVVQLTSDYKFKEVGKFKSKSPFLIV